MALLGLLHTVSAVPPGLRPGKGKDTTAEINARTIIERTNGGGSFGLVEVCGGDVEFGALCDSSTISTSTKATSTSSRIAVSTSGKPNEQSQRC